MNVLELTEAVRLRLDDFASEYQRFPDELILSWINEGQIESCRRGKLIKDSRTAAICEIDADANSFQYPIDPRIIRIERAKFAGVRHPLLKVSYKDMRDGWEDAPSSEPMYFFTDLDTGFLNVYPPKKTAGTLLLTVTREPLVPMEDDTDVPEIPARYHYSLIEWVVYRAMQHAGSKKDERASLTALSAFEEEFGKRNSALNESFEENNYPFNGFDGSF